MQKNNLHTKLYTKKLFNGSLIQLMPQDHVQQFLFWYGIYENETAKAFLEEAKSNFIFLDIGANIGYYSVLASSKINTGFIYAFEPNVELHSQIKVSMKLNNVTNFKIVPHAVSNIHNNTLDLFLSDADNKGMSALKEPENYSGKSNKISTVSIDNWCQENDVENVDLIKMDIEGAELDALLGMQVTLLKYKPIIFAEVCNKTLNRLV